jgi:hypothetical protein
MEPWPESKASGVLYATSAPAVFSPLQHLLQWKKLEEAYRRGQSHSIHSPILSKSITTTFTMSSASSTQTFKDEADRAKYEEVMKIVRPNPMLEKMKAGGLALIHTMSIASSIEIIGMAKFAGYDGLGINLEHERNSFGETVDLCCAATMCG